MNKSLNKIHKKRRENPFVMVDKNIIYDKRISWKAKGLMTYLLSRPDGWTFYLDEITNNSTDGRDGVRTGLNELEKYGYLVRIKTRNKDGLFSGMIWEIYEEPFEDPESSPEEDKKEQGKKPTNQNSDSKNKPNATKPLDIGIPTRNGFSDFGKSDVGKTDVGKTTTTNIDSTNKDNINNNNNNIDNVVEEEKVNEILRENGIYINSSAGKQAISILSNSFTEPQINKIAFRLSELQKKGKLINPAGVLISNPFGIGTAILDNTFYPNSDKKYKKNTDWTSSYDLYISKSEIAALKGCSQEEGGEL